MDRAFEMNRLVSALVLTAWLAAAAGAGDSEQQSAELLDHKGLVKHGTTYLLPAESSLIDGFRAIKELQRKVQEAEAAKARADVLTRDLDREIETLTSRRRAISEQLPQLAKQNPERHNEAVAAINQITVRLAELYERKRGSKEAQEAEKGLSTARQALIQNILDMRATVDTVLQTYAGLAGDREVRRALEALGQAGGRSFSLGPSPAFQGNIRQLERHERTIETDRIHLRREADTFWVPVVLDGRVTKELVFDTGASVISLPAEMAAGIGLTPGDSDPTVKVKLADGSVIEAKAMIIPSVRVGKFELEGVPCVVLPSQYKDAPPLLGGSFLNQFAYRIDAGAGLLLLSRLEGSASRRKGP